MSTKHTLATLFAGAVSTAICAVLGAILSLIGAKVTGLPEDSFSLEPLLYLLLGFIAGGLGFLILVAALPRKEGVPRVGSAKLGALALALLTGLLGYPISQHL